jgi:DNA-directed RNA polymerase specialized sigma24 family protein
MGYFCTAMWMEATRGQFKNLYLLQDTAPPPEPIYDPDLTLSIRREQVEIIIDRLGWFDKTVIKLYLEGFNISDVARESGIKPATLYQSLHRTKKIIANAIRQQPAKER